MTRNQQKGRPSKLTPEVQETICKFLRGGSTFRTACEVAGIGWGTGKEWRQRGEDRDPDRAVADEYAAFAAAVRRAEAETAARNVAVIQKAAAEGNWRAAAWWLARRFPSEWSQKVTGCHGQVRDTLAQVDSGLSTEAVKARVVELAAELGYFTPLAIGPGSLPPGDRATLPEGETE